jgi:hypothetical protein
LNRPAFQGVRRRQQLCIWREVGGPEGTGVHRLGYCYQWPPNVRIPVDDGLGQSRPGIDDGRNVFGPFGEPVAQLMALRLVLIV